jgi:hypothetical protein
MIKYGTKVEFDHEFWGKNKGVVTDMSDYGTKKKPQIKYYVIFGVKDHLGKKVERSDYFEASELIILE